MLPSVDYIQTFEITPELSIDKLVHSEFLPLVKVMPINVIEICEFGMTAILNNVVDHADGKKFTIKLLVIGQTIQIQIIDDGVGIFRNISEKLNLDSQHLSALELSKGNITTDPDYHAGDDISVVVHLFDKIKIIANGINLVYDNFSDGWNLDGWKLETGTTVKLKVNFHTTRSCSDVLKNVLGDDGVMRVPVVLAQANDEKLISPSQANYLVYNISDLDEIEFDFKGVDLIGPAFADGLIRKVKGENQSIEICWTNTTDTVDILMSRAAKRYA